MEVGQSAVGLETFARRQVHAITDSPVGGARWTAAAVVLSVITVVYLHHVNVVVVDDGRKPVDGLLLVTAIQGFGEKKKKKKVVFSKHV